MFLRLAVATFVCLGCSKPGETRARAQPATEAASSSSSGVAGTPQLAANAEPGLRFVGRVEVLGTSAAEYAWSGAGFVARFEGTGFGVGLVDHGNLHSLEVDGRALAPVTTTKGQGFYILASGLPAGEHVISLRRRTEAAFGSTRLTGIYVEAGRLLKPPTAKARQIEVLGDSISAGYGNLGPDTRCTFSPETENYLAAYPALLEDTLGAEVSTVAWSGRGVVKNYDGEAGTFIPELYPRTLPDVPTSRHRFTRTADAVIINLGTNDFSTEPDPEPVRFRDAYAALLAQLRTDHPQAFILCTLGPMLPKADLERAAAAIEDAIARRVAAGDRRVAYHALVTPNEQPGCDWHPSVATHVKMANELALELRRRLRW